MSTPSHLEILHARSSDQLSDPEFQRRGIPFLRAFLASLIHWERLDEGACARAYQLELVDSGTIEVISPFTGTKTKLTHSFILRNQMVFYGFADVAPVFMIVSQLGAGFPITGALFPIERLLVQIGHSVEWAPREEHVNRLAPLLESRRSPAAIASLRRVLVTGDHNFAHCAWNQLGAFEVLINSGLVDRLDEIMVTSEPLGNLEELFPEFAGRRVRRLMHRELEEFNTGQNLFIPMAGVRLTNGVRGRVMTVASHNLSAAGIRLRDTILGRQRGTVLPSFWISVRTRNRTASNQVDVLSKTVRALLHNFGASNIIFDGHSSSMDWEANLDIYRESVKNIISADQAEIQEILKSLEDILSQIPETNIIQAVGLPILDSIFLAQFADFYVCHHGSVQHKIGWFHPVPGVVHTNKVYLEHPPGLWVKSQSDCAVEPKYVRREWVTDLDRPDSYRHYPSHMQLQNYRIDDVPAMVGFVVENARAALRRDRATESR